MCRLFAYRGTPLPLSAWLLDAPHSLEKQAYQPREMVSGTVNVDGTGVTWWPGEDEPALRYLFDGPPWADPNFGHLMPRLLSGAQLGVVRSATPGIGHGIEHVQPFLDEETDLAFAHNGWIGGFRGAVGHALVSGLDPELLGTLPAFNDSAALFCAVAQRHRQGMQPADALAETLTEVVSRCQRNGHAASLNVVLATAETTIAARWAHGVPANSLYTSIREQGVLLASEALDTPEHWHPVQTGTVIELKDHTVTVTNRLS